MVTKQKIFDQRCVSCSNIFLRAGNNTVMLKDSIEHVEPLFIVLSELIMPWTWFIHVADNMD